MKYGLIAVLAFLLVAGGVVLGLASQKPDDFKVKRSVLIAATPEIIFPWLNNLQNGAKWSPWIAMEPDASYAYEGPAEGVGAITSWEGKKVGKGSMTITESIENQKVIARLDFEKPFASTAMTEYALEPVDGGVRVIWTMSGHNKFINKVMSVFMNCDKMVGTQFEKGLQSLKSIVEAE